MGFVCVKVKSRKTFCLLLFLILCLIISSEFTSAFSYRNYGVSNENERIEYLSRLGIDVSSETVKDAVIPQEFSPEFEKYNELQISVGYDLRGFRGCEAEIFEYPWNYNGRKYLVHLIVYEREVIGGDVSENRLNGEILPLKSIL